MISRKWELAISTRGKFIFYGGTFFLAWGISLQNIHLSIIGLFLIFFCGVCLIPHLINRKDVNISLKSLGDIYVGEQTFLRCDLLNKSGLNSYSFNITQPDSDQILIHLDLIPKIKSSVSLAAQFKKRSFSRKSTLCFRTFFPLGIFESTRDIFWDKPQKIFPARIQIKKNEFKHVNSSSEEKEFFYLRDYEKGDSLKLVDWKSSACSKRGLRTKVYKADAVKDEINIALIIPKLCPKTNFEKILSVLNEIVKKLVASGQVIYFYSPLLDNNPIKIQKSQTEAYENFIVSADITKYNDYFNTPEIEGLLVFGMGKRDSDLMLGMNVNNYVNLLELYYDRVK